VTAPLLARPAPTAELVAGDEAWCLLTDQVGRGERRQIRGAGRVRILEIVGGRYRCEVIIASRGVVGERLELGRGELYATRGSEHADFGALIGRLWGRDAHRR
jgi:hypothetical protein